MTDRHVPRDDAASGLQEAVDAIADAFGRPTSFAVEYTVDDGTKRTTLAVDVGETDRRYELVYDGSDDGEPRLLRLDDRGNEPDD